jgi:hypothetical protein
MESDDGLKFIIEADLTVETQQEQVIEKIIEAGGTQKQRCAALIGSIFYYVDYD